MKLLDKLTKMKLPTKEGKTSDDKTFYEDKYFIVFSELDDEPTFELETKLTIGSEVGDIIIDEESISPRHCTFTLNNDVVSVMDHNSESGTFIGKKEIGPGKMFILQDGDEVYVGDVLAEVFIEQVEIDPPSEIENTSTHEFKNIEEHQEQEQGPIEKFENTGSLELNTQILENKILESKQELLNEEIPDINLEEQQVKTIKEKPKELKFKGDNSAPDASSSLTRLLAMIADLLIMLIVLVLLRPFDEFRLFLQDFPIQIWNIIGPFYDEQLAPVVKTFLDDNPALVEISKDLSSFLNSDFQSFIGGFLLFGLVRIISTLILGVSLGQAIIGIRSHGNVVAKRFLGAIREFIGIFTGPFIIFDLGTLFNFRSVKELITFTRISSPNLLKSFTYSFVSLLILLIAFLISPLFQGLAFRESYPFKKSSVLKIKSPNIDQEFKNSKYIGLSLKLPENEKELSLFSFTRKNKKLLLMPYLRFINNQKQKSVELKKYKSFSLKKLIKIGLGQNYFAETSFPELYKYTHDASEVNTNFTNHNFDDTLFAKELKKLIDSSLSLSFLNFFEHSITYGPLIKGNVDFRDSLFNLLGADVNEIFIDHLGDTYFAFFDVKDSKSTRLLMIPLVVDAATIYELKAQKKGFNFKNIKLLFKNSSWKAKNISVKKEVNYLSFMDQVVSEKNPPVEYMQKMYELIYEDIKVAMQSESPFIISQWEQVLNNYINVIDKVKLSKNNQDQVWQKLYQNLNDLLKALRDKDSSFFGITTVERV